MKTKIYQFDPVIYPFPLLVCKYIHGVTPQEIAERFNEVADRRSVIFIDENDLRASPTVRANTMCVVEKGSGHMGYLVILYNPKETRWGSVAHESLHIVTMLNEWVGIPPIEFKHDETSAYLISWLADCIGSVIDGRPETMKGRLLELSK